MLQLLRLNRYEAFFLFFIYLLGLYLRLAPRLELDPHLLTFQGDIWYRITMAQYILDNWRLPEPDIRYLAYGYVPMWYPPLSLIFLALTSHATGLDLPTVCSRLMPFLEALTPLSLYFLARYLYGQRAAVIATSALALTPNFVFWSGITDPQSFSLFMIPLLVLFWLYHAKAGKSNARLLAFGLLLAFNFLVHLTYFLVVLVLFTVTLALVIKEEADKGLFADLGVAVLISQLLTLPWWLPRELYWWWVKALVTSSGMYSVSNQLAEYGFLAALLGLFSLLYVASKGRKHLLLVLWALPLLLETQNEAILAALGRSELAWSTLAKPLEGFRFYPFLAQPLSIATGVLLADAAKKMKAKSAYPILALLLFLGLLASLKIHRLDNKFQASGLIIEEYEAAKWYREHSLPGDRIIADYYRAQMFAGVAGGKALLGGMFPLRNVDYPYIKAPGVVQDDLYILYNTSDAGKAASIAKKYNATHIFYSGNMISYGNLLSSYKNPREFGVDIDREKFYDNAYFEIIYRKESPLGEVVIVKVKF
jgi:4-amino-4-deoxy-L-arabinose transferase-like glycosyltransferase